MAVGIVTLAWPSVTVLALVILVAVYAFIVAGLQAARAIVRGPVYRKPAWGDAMGEKKPLLVYAARTRLSKPRWRTWTPSSSCTRTR